MAASRPVAIFAVTWTAPGNPNRETAVLVGHMLAPMEMIRDGSLTVMVPRVDVAAARALGLAAGFADPTLEVVERHAVEGAPFDALRFLAGLAPRGALSDAQLAHLSLRHYAVRCHRFGGSSEEALVDPRPDRGRTTGITHAGRLIAASQPAGCGVGQ